VRVRKRRPRPHAELPRVRGAAATLAPMLVKMMAIFSFLDANRFCIVRGVGSLMSVTKTCHNGMVRVLPAGIATRQSAGQSTRPCANFSTSWSAFSAKSISRTPKKCVRTLHCQFMWQCQHYCFGLCNNIGKGVHPLALAHASRAFPRRS
jgi:hypothetical protein